MYTSLRWHYPTGSYGRWQFSHPLSLIPQAPENILLLLSYKNSQHFARLPD